MSKKELNQAEVLLMVKTNAITLKKAAELSNLSYKQTRRKYTTYKESCAVGLMHKSRGKTSNRITDVSIINKIINLIKSTYSGFGPTLLSEKLK